MAHSHDHRHDHGALIEFDDPHRHRIVSRSTWVSIVVNVFLTVVQIVVGWFTHSQALIADGVHSLSDLVCDFLVLVANYHSKAPADAGHPYGHARVETAASFALGAILVATGGAIIVSAGFKLQNLESLPPVGVLALWTALVTLAAKETLFRYMLHVGESLRSPMLIANAWHARSDAASSLVVAIGIGGNLLGFTMADSIAAIVVGFMIVRMGVVFAWDAFQELIDAGLDIEVVDGIRQTLRDTPGVISLHELRTRRMAHRALVDAHILVDPRISVSEGHSIAEAARTRVLANYAEVLDVLVHVDPEDDSQLKRGPLPSRSELEGELAAMLGVSLRGGRIVLHYLNDRVEADVTLPVPVCNDPGAMRQAQAQAQVDGHLAEHPHFSAIRLHCQVT